MAEPTLRLGCGAAKCRRRCRGGQVSTDWKCSTAPRGASSFWCRSHRKPAYAAPVPGRTRALGTYGLTRVAVRGPSSDYRDLRTRAEGLRARDPIFWISRDTSFYRESPQGSTRKLRVEDSATRGSRSGIRGQEASRCSGLADCLCGCDSINRQLCEDPRSRDSRGRGQTR